MIQGHFITGRNEVLAKVMFLHVSVILLTGGGCLPGGGVSAGGVPPNFLGGGVCLEGGVPPNFRGGSSKFFGGGCLPGGGVSARGGFLQIFRGGPFFGGVLPRNTVNVRPVRILLECILVVYCITLILKVCKTVNCKGVCDFYNVAVLQASIPKYSGINYCKDFSNLTFVKTFDFIILRFYCLTDFDKSYLTNRDD